MCMHLHSMPRTLGNPRGQIPKLKVSLPTPGEVFYTIENQGINPEKGKNIKKLLLALGYSTEDRQIKFQYGTKWSHVTTRGRKHVFGSQETNAGCFSSGVRVTQKNQCILYIFSNAQLRCNCQSVSHALKTKADASKGHSCILDFMLEAKCQNIV